MMASASPILPSDTLQVDTTAKTVPIRDLSSSHQQLSGSTVTHVVRWFDTSIEDPRAIEVETTGGTVDLTKSSLFVRSSPGSSSGQSPGHPIELVSSVNTMNLESVEKLKERLADVLTVDESNPKEPIITLKKSLVDLTAEEHKGVTDLMGAMMKKAHKEDSTVTRLDFQVLVPRKRSESSAHQEK
ncbi:hypothetical protein H0H93_004278 [Arthromyces matolae]|nr:hypothetical protein H0H93_004278 [Arthromyces matolae]